MRLILSGITRTYGKTRALTDFSCNLGVGIYALLGPNGSGKSTLMNIISGNLRPDSGKILIEDDDNNLTEAARLGNRFREMLGFMPQYSELYPSFSVWDFMWYMAALKNLPRSTAASQIEEILEQVELIDVRHRTVRALSGGMRQRLSLAQAVLGSPKILLLDEPTAGLDPVQRMAVKNYISRIAFDKTVIIATHLVADVEHIATRAILLKRGIICADDTPHSLTKAICGKVWTLASTEEEISSLSARYRVTAISDNGTGVLLRLLSDSPPPAAVPAEPTLEDYYLYTFVPAQH